MPGIFVEGYCDGHILKSKEGDIYFINDKEKIYLLAKNADVYPICIAHYPLPQIIEDLQDKLDSFGPYSEEMLSAHFAYYNENMEKRLYFVLKYKNSFEPKVFIWMPGGYQEIPSVYIGGISKAIIAAGKLLLSENCYRYNSIKMKRLLLAPEYILFWGGESQLVKSYVNNGKLDFVPLGRFVRLTKTGVSNLLEVKEENKFALYHISKTLNLIAYTPFENGFEIDEKNGKVITHAAIMSCGVQNITRTYVYKKGKYKKT
ncbi:MAG: hypothetical protein J6W96_06050 [Alphaproteobacteria bacterium]|nr:hypothetical protein [Alphaproteobacteria bacterium]